MNQICFKFAPIMQNVAIYSKFRMHYNFKKSPVTHNNKLADPFLSMKLGCKIISCC